MTGSYHVYTDGSFRSPGCGAWGALILEALSQEPVAEVFSGVWDTTNNRMEMSAVGNALRCLPVGADVTIFADSRYTIDCFTKWHWGWKRNNWITLTGKPVSNRDLIEPTLDLLNYYKVKFTHVYGHSGNTYNEIVDDRVQGITSQMKYWRLNNPTKALTEHPKFW